MKIVYVVWHFDGEQTQLQAVCSTEEKAQKACRVGDCYMPMELDTIYDENLDSTPLCLYKAPNGKFIDFEEFAERNGL